MPDQNKNVENTLEVIVQAIDGEALVLQTPNGDLIHWPLNQLTKPLTLGKTLNLKLEPTDQVPQSPKIKGYVTKAKDLDSTAKANHALKDSTAATIAEHAASTRVSQKEKSISITPPPDEDPKITRMRKLLENIING